MEIKQDSKRLNKGKVVAIRGSIVDVFFPDRLPEPHSLLKAGENGKIALEAMTYLDDRTIAAIALTSTRGLARGETVIDTNHPLEVPVGEKILGRMFNVFGEAIDKKEPLQSSKLRSIHSRPVAMSDRATTTEIFQTGIKAIDVLVPLECDSFLGE